MNCCSCKLEIIFPLSKEELEIIIEFLYSGQITCDDKTFTSEILQKLTEIFGFPYNMDFTYSIVKTDGDFETGE